MSCKFVFFFGIIYLCIIQSQAAGLKKTPKLLANDKTCYIEHYGEPLSEAEWIEGVDIDSRILDIAPTFKKLYTARTRNVREIVRVNVNGKELWKEPNINYLLVRDEKNDELEFIMALGTGFKNYEENETSVVMSVNVTFLCENNYYKSLEIRQKIVDTNNHDPRFRPSEFKFYVPTYLGANYVIGQVTARDVDLTNSYISFNFRSTGNNTEGDYALLGSYQDQNDPKTFHALLVTRANVSLPYQNTIDIYAQDSGKPSRTGNARVYLLPESLTSIVTPESTTPSSLPPEEENPTSPLPEEENPASPPAV